MIPKPVLEFADRKFQSCSKCKQILEQDQFSLSRQRKSGRYSSCKKCRSLDWETYKQTPGYKAKLERTKILTKQNTIALRLEVLTYYSNGLLQCMCPGCNIQEYEFLCIDHIEGEGNKHRKSGNIGKGTINLYSWLKRNNFPKGFQVLCHNCNMAKSFYKGCPHIKKAVGNAA